MELPCPQSGTWGLMLQLLPIPDSVPPTPGEQIFIFVLFYGLLLTMAMIAMPKKWSDRLMRIAFLRDD
jgi:hypothetical protein